MPGKKRGLQRLSAVARFDPISLAEQYELDAVPSHHLVTVHASSPSHIIKVWAAGPDGRSRQRGRKVRTPQSSVPDNVREARFKPGRRKVPQKIYRPVVVVSPRLVVIPPQGATGLERRRGKGEKVR